MSDSIGSTAVSTRIRLARNFAGYLFPSRLTERDTAREIVRRVYDAVRDIDAFRLCYMSEIEEGIAENFKENYLISQALLDRREYSALILNEDEDVALMLNEEDHIREQCFQRGLNLWRGYEMLSGIDETISSRVPFAFDTRLGYLTSCPSNLGTGLRASVMLFLPGLTMNGLVPKLAEQVSRLGLTMRGAYGEGSTADGYLYQLSNEITLGLSEREILTEVESAVMRIVEYESKEREKLSVSDPVSVKDLCLRALGILTHCAVLSYREFVQHISNVKLGAALSMISVDDIGKIDDLIVAMRPSNLNRLKGSRMPSREREIFRAECVGSAVAHLVKE